MSRASLLDTLSSVIPWLTRRCFCNQAPPRFLLGEDLASIGHDQAGKIWIVSDVSVLQGVVDSNSVVSYIVDAAAVGSKRRRVSYCPLSFPRFAPGRLGRELRGNGDHARECSAIHPLPPLCLPAAGDPPTAQLTTEDIS